MNNDTRMSLNGISMGNKIAPLFYSKCTNAQIRCLQHWNGLYFKLEATWKVMKHGGLIGGGRLKPMTNERNRITKEGECNLE